MLFFKNIVTPEEIEELRQQVLAVRLWLIKSGFPSTWPLKTSFEENQEIVELLVTPEVAAEENMVTVIRALSGES